MEDFKSYFSHMRFLTAGKSLAEIEKESKNRNIIFNAGDWFIDAKGCEHIFDGKDWIKMFGYKTDLKSSLRYKSEEKILTYKCMSCGASISFNNSSGAIKCPYCRTSYLRSKAYKIEGREPSVVY